MRRLFCVALCLALIPGCAWFSANRTAISSDALGLLSCVSNAALAGNPIELIFCGGLSIVDIIDLLDATHTPIVPSSTLTLALQAHPRVKTLKLLQR